MARKSKIDEEASASDNENVQEELQDEEQEQVPVSSPTKLRPRKRGRTMERNAKNSKKQKLPTEKEEIPTDTETDEEAEFEVDKIVDVHMIRRTGKKEYLVKWKGYSNKDNTWEPEDNLQCPELLQEFLERQEAENLSRSDKLRKQSRSNSTPFKNDMRSSKVSKQSLKQLSSKSKSIIKSTTSDHSKVSNWPQDRFIKYLKKVGQLTCGFGIIFIAYNMLNQMDFSYNANTIFDDFNSQLNVLYSQLHD